MISTISEFRLFDDEAASCFENGDLVKIETNCVLFKEVTITAISEDVVTVEDDDNNEFEIATEHINDITHI